MNLFSLDPFNSLCPVQKSQEIITDFPQEDVILVTDLSVRTLSGVERWEREKKQNIIINLWIFCDTQSSAQQDSLACSFNYGIIAKTVTNYCEESSFKTLEALAFSIAKLCILENQVPKITVRVSKPCALIQAKCASVEITRTKADFVISSISPIKIQNYWDKIILQGWFFRFLSLSPNWLPLTFQSANLAPNIDRFTRVCHCGHQSMGKGQQTKCIYEYHLVGGLSKHE
eukprot:Sdes_comp20850_c0_seq3m17590